MTTPNENEEFEFLYQMEQEAKAGIPPPNPAPVKASMGDTVAGLPITRLAMGAASPLIGAAQLGAHAGDWLNRQMGVEPVVSPWIDKQLATYEAAKQRGMQAAGNEGFDWMGLGGSLAPSAAIAKGVGAALPTAKSLLARMGVGAVQGGVAAGAQPVTNTEEGFWTPKGIQTAVGTTMGGAVPLVTDAVKGLGQVVTQATQPFTEKGRAAILKEFQEGLMGNNPQTKQQIIHALTQAKTLVPGSRPTAGEALAHIPASTGLAAHQKDVAKLPVVSPQFAQRGAEQEAARAGAIGQVAQTPSALEQAIERRSTLAKTLYGAAGKEVVTPDAAFGELVARPSMQSVLRRAAELAKEKGDVFKIGQDLPERMITSPIVSASGQPITQTLSAEVAKFPVKSLHYMKMAMDDLIKDPERFGIGANEARAIAGTQGEFVNWLGGKAPDFAGKSPMYGLAREAYKVKSGPINRMQVGQELERALTTPLGTSERSGVFAKAMQDAPRTIKRATGQQMFDTLEDVLQPQEVSSVKKIAEELARKDAFSRLARGTKVSGSEAIPGQVGLPLPNLLSRPAMIANFMLRHAGKGAEAKIAKLAANQYLNPAELATALQDVPPRYRPMIDALLQQAPAAAGTATGRNY